MTPSASESSHWWPCPDLPCRNCRRALHLDGRTGYVSCPDWDCSSAGIEIPLWRAIDRATGNGQPDRNPQGARRPRLDGLPLPWVTPVTPSGRVLWRLLHRGRLVHCQTAWACQVCGLLPSTAGLITYADGRCPTSAAVHYPRCAWLAIATCPHPASAQIRTHQVTRADITTEGDTGPELGLSQVWRRCATY